MASAILQPNDRYAFVGKTRAGKTALAMLVAAQFARALADPWEVWWCDTKDDPDDIEALRKWGARNYMSEQDQKTSKIGHKFKYWLIRPAPGLSVIDQAQAIFQAAYEQRKVLVCVDEYVQVCPSSRNAGEALLNIFQRGGGRKVGLIGLTQEPVYVPRQLLSQATHLALLSLSHGYDIDYIQKMVREYKSPLQSMKDPYGFWWKWVDGNGEVVYYPNQSAWYDQLTVARPKNKEPELIENGPTQTREPASS
jgi:hypothetical protein